MNDNTDSLILSNERPGNVIIYTSDDGRIKLDVQIGGETVWLTKGQMAQLFGRDRTVVGRHIANIYNEGELQKDITCAKFAHMGVAMLKAESEYRKWQENTLSPVEQAYLESIKAIEKKGK